MNRLENAGNDVLQRRFPKVDQTDLVHRPTDSTSTGAVHSSCTNSRPNCEFCSELFDSPDTRFGNLYGASVRRTVLDENGFVALPTIGQLFEASMLVLPKIHVERMADL